MRKTWFRRPCLRAFRFFDGFRGEHERTWLLKIVRNTCYTWLQKNRAQEPTTPFDEEMHSYVTESKSPESLLLRNADHQLLSQALDELPTLFREVLVLLSWKSFLTKRLPMSWACPSVLSCPGWPVAAAGSGNRRLAFFLAEMPRAPSPIYKQSNPLCRPSELSNVGGITRFHPEAYRLGSSTSFEYSPPSIF